MPEGHEQPGLPARQRLDKWLFFTRLAKSRAVAQKWIAEGDIRVNGQTVQQASHTVKPGDRVEILSWRSIRRQVRAVEVVAPGDRRAAYEIARQLYIDHGFSEIEE